jgi:hypothetical protein
VALDEVHHGFDLGAFGQDECSGGSMGTGSRAARRRRHKRVDASQRRLGRVPRRAVISASRVPVAGCRAGCFFGPTQFHPTFLFCFFAASATKKKSSALGIAKKQGNSSTEEARQHVTF